MTTDVFFGSRLAETDPDVLKAIEDEYGRQRDQIELIASENIVSRAVLDAVGNLMINKYAEGYPGRRYYGGCEFVDVAESLAIERAKKLFDCEFVNVQAHSGSQANQAVFLALIKPGDTILGMSLAAVGEMPAGGSAYPRTIDFQKFRDIADKVGAYLMVDMAHFAGLVATGLHPSPLPIADIVTTTTHKTLRGPRGGMVLSRDADIGKKINSAIFPGLQGGPLMHIIAAKAVAFGEALKPEFKTYIEAVCENASTLAQVMVDRGLDIVSGGTDTHLMLVDLRPKKLTGKAAEASMENAAITCNKNGVPFDPEKPMVTSGVRLGTPAATSRGFGVAEFTEVGNMIGDVLDGLAANPDDNSKVEGEVHARVLELCGKFPIYKEAL